MAFVRFWRARSIAMLTLGFREMDSFSQAKLSYVYGLRDQIAQLVWNLILKERMKSQSQVDGLTGLLSYSYFPGGRSARESPQVPEVTP